MLGARLETEVSNPTAWIRYVLPISLIAMLDACESGSERTVAPAASGATSSLEIQEGDGFRLAIPAATVMTRTDPVEDFSLYVVSQEDGTNLLRIYSGTAPSLRP